jgi:thiol-disulfide isomerase/thioredoxin
MNIRTLLFALAAFAVIACGQSADKKTSKEAEAIQSQDNLVEESIPQYKVIETSLPQLEKFFSDTTTVAEEKVALYEETLNVLMEEYNVMRDSLSTDEEKSKKYYEDFLEDYKTFNIKAAEANTDNEVALYALQNLMGMIEDDQTEAIIAKLSEEFKQHDFVVRLNKGLDARKATAEGMMFTDFTVEHVYGYDRSMDPQPLKKEVKFSDYVGKGTYVLVDFWSPWCGPCRREIPNIQQVYAEYKDKGLEVLSLAVWENQPQSHTIETAAKLGMDWLHINNCGNVPTDIYGVEGIPHLMLIGPDGTILKRGFHGLDGIKAAVAEFIK